MTGEIFEYPGGAPIQPVHPGLTVAGELKARGLTQAALCRHISISASRLSEIVNCKRAITPDTAVRLGKAFGNGGLFWLRLQGNYDLAMVRKRAGT